MRFGILTFSRANNYGAVLQAYALRQKLQDMGQKSQLINYHCKRIDAMHTFKGYDRSLSGKENRERILWNLRFWPRMLAFNRFRRGVHTGKHYYRNNIAEANKVFDAFVTGSDQVFNLNLTGGDSTYFLDFAQKDKLRVAYAVSMGEYLQAYDRIYRDNLSEFDFISFREKTGSDTLLAETGISSQTVPDPVLLYTKEEWIRMLGLKQRKNQKPYLLIYALGKTPCLAETADNIAKELGLEVRMITRAAYNEGNADTYLRHLGPREFVEEIYNAEYVVTPSFHGTAFCAIFGKAFTITTPVRLPERITDLLAEIGLSSRFSQSPDNYDLSPIDYEQVYLRLQKVRERGENYLREVVAAAEAKKD